MLSKQNISVQLKLMLSALLFVGCNSENTTYSSTVGYLTANLKYEKVETSEFYGTIVSELKPAGFGVVNLEVKVESNKGEKIKIKIQNYQPDKIYSLEEVSNESWDVSPFENSSGSLRYCVAERFFFDGEAGSLSGMGRTFF